LVGLILARNKNCGTAS